MNNQITMWVTSHVSAASACNLVGYNPTFAKNRSGASPIPGFFLNCYIIVMNTGIGYVL